MAAAVAFSDLDGTLLDHDTYAWEAAGEGMQALRDAGVPLVLASSKTRAEMEVWRRRLGNSDPFITENGGGAYVPAGHPGFRVAGAVSRDDYDAIELGVSYPRLCKLLPEIARQSGLDLRGFHDLPVARISDLTGLSGDDLDRSMKREFDEPFIVPPDASEDAWQRLCAAADEHGLRVTRGGRFGHLLGRTNKGLAARHLINARASALGASPTTFAVGDADNDLELLREVDYPVVVAGRTGRHAAGLRAALPHAMFTPGRGPAGFTEGILATLVRLTQ